MAKQGIKSKAEVLQDLQVVLYVTMHELNRMYGATSEIALIDTQSHVVTTFSDRTETGAALLDISEMEVTTFLGLLYDYAVDGRLNTELNDSWEIVDEDIIGFFEGIARFPLILNNADDFPMEHCLHVLALANARRALDFGGFVVGEHYDIAGNCILLKDVALLAGIDEKTARNLAHPNAPNRLETTKWQGRTVVDRDFAREWLKARGFKETVEFDTFFERDLAKNGFGASLSALGYFVSRHRERHGLSHEELLRRCEISPNAVEWLKQLEEGKGTYDQDKLARLAETFAIPVKPFVLAALKTFHAAEIQRLELTLQ